jgi:hypothetical protein
MRTVLLNSTEAALPTTAGTATTLNASITVRVANTGTASATVYRLQSVSGTVLGSCSVLPYEALYLFKDPTDYIYASASTVQAASISFIS